MPWCALPCMVNTLRLSAAACMATCQTLACEAQPASSEAPSRMRHAVQVGNAVTEGRQLVIGTGSSAVMLAAVWALSQRNASADLSLLGSGYFGGFEKLLNQGPTGGCCQRSRDENGLEASCSSWRIRSSCQQHQGFCTGHQLTPPVGTCYPRCRSGAQIASTFMAAAELQPGARSCSDTTGHHFCLPCRAVSDVGIPTSTL